MIGCVTVYRADFNGVHIVIIDYPYCQYSVRAPDCLNGFRCSLGECLPFASVCNGIEDCHDGQDEKLDYCTTIGMSKCIAGSW